MLKTLGVVALIALATILTRAAPFVLMPAGKPLPPFLAYLGKVLPGAVMAMLVVYCLKDVAWAAAPHGLPELLALAAVVGLHVWKRNTLLSVGAGTALYMLLVQVVFV